MWNFLVRFPLGTGRKLNVLCTFNLRPVSRGLKPENLGKCFSFRLWTNFHCTKTVKIQKQPSRGVLRKSCSENMLQISRRTPMTKSTLNKVALQKKVALKNTSGGLFGQSSRSVSTNMSDTFSRLGHYQGFYICLENCLVLPDIISADIYQNSHE